MPPERRINASMKQSHRQKNENQKANQNLGLGSRSNFQLMENIEVGQRNMLNYVTNFEVIETLNFDLNYDDFKNLLFFRYEFGIMIMVGIKENSSFRNI